MKTSVSLVLLQALAAQAVRIVQSNDDGWAELYIRDFNDALNKAGHEVVLSGPAENQSGRSKYIWITNESCENSHKYLRLSGF